MLGHVYPNHKGTSQGPDMSKFSLGKKSLDLLANVDPRMRLIALRAIQITEIDFGVVQGKRTLDEQKRLYGKGRTGAQCEAKGVPAIYARPGESKVTWTLNSNHLSGRAIDICPWINGKYEWDNNGKLGVWPKLAKAFKQAASELGHDMEWGGDWEKTVDRPHFELKA